MRETLTRQQERRVIAEGKMFRFRYVAELQRAYTDGAPVASCSFDSYGFDYHVCGVVGWSSALQEVRCRAEGAGYTMGVGDLITVRRYDLAFEGLRPVPEVRTYEVGLSGELVRLSLVRRAQAVGVN